VIVGCVCCGGYLFARVIVFLIMLDFCWISLGFSNKIIFGILFIGFKENELYEEYKYESVIMQCLNIPQNYKIFKCDHPFGLFCLD